MTLFVVAPDELLTNGWKLLEQGPESQFASAICSGGVSAVMGSSDLDTSTLVSDEADGNQLSCSLPIRADPPMLEMACLSRLRQHPNAKPAREFLDRDPCARPGGVDGAEAKDDPPD